MKKKNKINFAVIKNEPAPGHPAQYRKKGDDKKIEFVSFTHSSEVDLNKFFSAVPEKKEVKIPTVKLKHNIGKVKESTNEPSRVVPVVYEGDRTLLGENRNKKYKINSANDKRIIDNIFKTGMRIKINSQKKK